MLTSKQAADKLKVDPAYVRQLCIKGTFPNARKHGRDWLIPESDVAAYDQRRPKPKK